MIDVLNFYRNSARGEALKTEQGDFVALNYGRINPIKLLPKEGISWESCTSDKDFSV